MDDATLCLKIARTVMEYGDPIWDSMPFLFNIKNKSGDVVSLDVSWESVGIVIEKMRERGWRFYAELRRDGLWVVSFRMGKSSETLAYQYSDESFPRATYMSALGAMGELT